MGILQRLRFIILSKMNKVLDNMEDPEEMLNQYMRNMSEDISSVKADTASVIAVNASISRKINLVKREIDELDRFARFALSKNNEADAKVFLNEKLKKEDDLTALKDNLSLAQANTQKMLKLHSSIMDDYARAQERSALLKSRIKVLNTQDIINRSVQSCNHLDHNYELFNEIEDRINTRLEESLALEALNAYSDAGIDDLKDKYSSMNHYDMVETALLEMKKEVA